MIEEPLRPCSRAKANANWLQHSQEFNHFHYQIDFLSVDFDLPTFLPKQSRQAKSDVSADPVLC